MAGSTAHEGAIGYADRLRKGVAGGGTPKLSAAVQGPVRRLTSTLLFRAVVGLLLGFLLTQPAIYLTYSEQANAQRTHQAAQRMVDTDLDVQHLLLAMRTLEAGVSAYAASADPVFLRDQPQAQQEAALARSLLRGHVIGTGLERLVPPVETSMDIWLRWASTAKAAVDATRRPLVDPAEARRGVDLFESFQSLGSALDRTAAAEAAALRAAATRALGVSLRDDPIGSEGGELLLVAIAAVLLTFALRPISRLAWTAGALAAGEERAIPYGRRRDEVGQLAQALTTWRVTEASQRVVFKHLPIGLFIMTLDGRLESINPATERMTGYDHAQLARMDMAQLQSMADRPRVAMHDADAIRAEFDDMVDGRRERSYSEQRYWRPDGSRYWGALTMTPIRDSDGRALFVMGMLEDITERKEKLIRAAEIQRELLPKSAPDIVGYELAGTCLTAEEVGGDFYDWYLDESGTLTVTLGDVMGKGMSGAILMAAVRTGLRAGSSLPSVAATVHSLAGSIAASIEQADAFVTLFHARLGIASGQLHYVDAGHGLAVVLRADGTVLRPETTEMPLGIMPGQLYTESSLQLDPGDTLLVFSDGVLDLYPEMTNPEKAAEVLRDAHTAQQVLNRLTARGHSSRLEDDVTMVVMRRTGEVDPTHEPTVAVECAATSRHLGLIHDALVRFWRQVPQPSSAPDLRMRFDLAVMEIAANIVEHARPERLHLRMTLSGGRVVAEFADRGRQWSPPAEVAAVDHGAERGRGLALARTAVDEVAYRREGTTNRWRLVKRL